MKWDIGVNPFTGDPWVGGSITWDFDFLGAPEKGEAKAFLRKGFTINVEFKPQDLWVGLYWKRSTMKHSELWKGLPSTWEAWLCLVPMLPIHISRVVQMRTEP